MTSGPKLSETSHGPLRIKLIRSKASFIILPLALYQWNTALWGAIKWATFVVFWVEVRECWTARLSHCSTLNCVCVAHEPRDLKSSCIVDVSEKKNQKYSAEVLLDALKKCNATKKPHHIYVFIWFGRIL